MKNTPNNEMQRRPNWLQIVQNTVDQYDDPTHGVQKDAIQNGRDAIPPEGRKRDGTLNKDYVKDNWKFSFELGEVIPQGKEPVRALFMTDFGTTGLTGERRVGNFNSDEEVPLGEKWARFESYAMANEGGQTLGARGQGKFVFVSASNRKEIIYDTRKVDGKYRVGYTTVTVGSSPVTAYDNKDGEKWIRDKWGIEPVHPEGIFGTRIIIIDPNEDLVTRLKSGAFLENIEETWWPFIRDFGARIDVTVDGVTSVATIPKFIQKIQSDKENNDLKQWKKDGLKFKFGQWAGKEYTIKELRIASIVDGNLPEAYRGIAVFRGGMKVQSVQPLYGYDFESRIIGYVLLDPKGDEMLRKIEKPSHYEFNNTGIWKKLESIIKEEAQKFGAEKLGIGINNSSSPEEKRQASVSKALQIFNFLSKDWPLDLNGHGSKSQVHPPGPLGSIKNCYISIKDFVFPNPARVPRLNYGDAMSGWSLEIGNIKAPAKSLQLECGIFSASSKLFEIVNEEIDLKTDSVYCYKGNDSGLNFSVSKDMFPGPGKYRITATITDPRTKKIVDEINRFFWIEMDPPLQAPFDMKPLAFSEFVPDKVESEWRLQLGDDNNIVYYNTDHPSFVSASRNKSEEIFLGEVAGMAGMQLLISSISVISPEEARSKKLPFDYDALFGEDHVVRYLETIKVRDFIRHKILSNYLT